MAGVCGKDCKGCAYRQQYGCRGCLETGGHPVWGSCRVAACCHSQGRQNCDECPSHDGCGKPGEMETARQQWARDEENRCVDWREGLARRTPLMAQWLPVLFWMGLASEVLNLIDELPLSQSASALLSVISLCLSIGSLVAYWKLSVLSERLRLVWRLQIVSLVMTAALILLMLPALLQPALGSGLAVLATVGALGVAVVSLIALYQFCEAMAEELEQSDPPGVGQAVPMGFRGGEGHGLADSWRHLRKCTFWSMGILVGCLLLALLLQGGMFLLLLALAAALVLAGCGVAQLVMLWKSGRFFRELPPVYEPLPPAEE